MPFTMEGTTLEAAGTSNGFCVASLVLGIIGLPASCIPFIVPVLALIVRHHRLQPGQSRPTPKAAAKGMAIAGIVLGVIGCLISAYVVSNMLLTALHARSTASALPAARRTSLPLRACGCRSA